MSGVPTGRLGERLRLVCASANSGKVAEIQSILGDVVDVAPRPTGVPDVVEDAGSLIGNARLKAIAIARATGQPAVADDTGLEVAALDDAPGVETASYAGLGASDADNRAKLLSDLDGAADRRARFRTVAMVVWPDGAERWADGVCEGAIVGEPRGTAGFGYDSVFVPNVGGGRTFAEMTESEKSAISHRGRAFRALLELLSNGVGEAKHQ